MYKKTKRKSKWWKTSNYILIGLSFILFLVVLLGIGIVLNDYQISLTGFVISENISSSELRELKQELYEREDVEESFEGKMDLKIKAPDETWSAEPDNKNKRMDFQKAGDNIRLYFDLLDYSKFTEGIAEKIGVEESKIDFEKVKSKSKELNKSELDEIEDISEIELKESEFEIEINEGKAKESGIDYKWGYEVELKDLNFMAKIDVTSEKDISIYSSDSLKIGNSVLSFQDLVDSGYKVRFEKPVLEINKIIIIEREIEEEIKEETGGQISEQKDTGEIIGTLENKEEDGVKEVEETIEFESVKDSVSKSEPIVTDNKINSLTAFVTKGFTGLTGFVISREKTKIKDVYYENTVSVYIERDFGNVANERGEDYKVGDIIYLDPSLVIIPITDAEHLDENRDFVSNIYNEVKEQDGVWSEVISEGHYVRASFEEELDNTRDISVYARSVKGVGEVGIYRENGDELIGVIEGIGSEGLYKTYLTLLSEGESYDVFDLRSLGSGIELDWIVDPDVPPNVSITSPVNPTYNEVSAPEIMEYTCIDDVDCNTCWFSSDFGATNESFRSGVTIEEPFEITPSEGTNTYYVYCNDTIDSLNFSTTVFSYDSIDPVVNLVSPADSYSNVSNNQLMNFSYNVTDANSISNCSLTIGGVTNMTNTNVTNNVLNNFSAYFRPGEYVWGVNCYDNHSNFVDGSMSPNSFTITAIDIVPPNVSITSPVNPTYNEDDFLDTMVYTCSDDVSCAMCWFSSDFGDTNESLQAHEAGAFSITPSQGTNTYYVYCNDTQGNLNFSSVVFSYDSIDPVVNLVSPADSYSNVSNNQLMNFSYNVTDANSISNCSLTIGGVTNMTNTNVTNNVLNNFSAYFRPGEYVWGVNCYDNHSNFADGSLSPNSFTITTPSSGSSSGSSSGGSSGIIEPPEDGEEEIEEEIENIIDEELWEDFEEEFWEEIEDYDLGYESEQEDIGEEKLIEKGIVENIREGVKSFFRGDSKTVKKDLKPVWKCEEWEECDAQYDIKKILKERIRPVLKGVQKRVCIDNNGNFPDKTERKDCEIKVSIKIEKVEKCFKDSVFIYDESGKLISSLDVDKGSSKLNLNFLQGDYCGYCFNGIKDFDEEGIDCGGNGCPDCKIKGEIGVTGSVIGNTGKLFRDKYFLGFAMFFLIMLLGVVVRKFKKL